MSHENQTWRISQEVIDGGKIIAIAQRETAENRVAKLIELGILTKLGGYSWGTILGNRFVVFANIKGVPVPMYRTASHTSGKRSDLNFFPFFGVRKGFGAEQGWPIKGSIDEINSFHGLHELENASEILTEVFDFDTERSQYAPIGKEVKDEQMLNGLLEKRFGITFPNMDSQVSPFDKAKDEALYEAVSSKVFDEIRKGE